MKLSAALALRISPAKETKQTDELWDISIDYCLAL